MINKTPSLPSKEIVSERWEAIDPDSLQDAFEVEEDSIDRIFDWLMSW